LADIVVSDINLAGVHKLKGRHRAENKHFVVSAERVIYEVALKEKAV
jgi:hypothetical protein